MSVMSGHAIGNAYTASNQVSRSLSLGRHIETWRRSDLWLAHGEEALAKNTPLINPWRSCGIRSKKRCSGNVNQSTRIEAVRSWIELSRYMVAFGIEVCDSHKHHSVASDTYVGPTPRTIAGTWHGGPVLFSPTPLSHAEPSAQETTP